MSSSKSRNSDSLSHIFDAPRDPIGDLVRAMLPAKQRQQGAPSETKRRESLREIDLSDAGDIAVYFPGNFIVSDNVSTGIVSISPNELSASAPAPMTFYPGASYKGPFEQFRISWVAQPGAFARVIFGRDVEFKPGLGKTNAYNPKNSYVAPINLLASAGNLSHVQLFNSSIEGSPIDIEINTIYVSSPVSGNLVFRVMKSALTNAIVATSQKFQSAANSNYYGAGVIRHQYNPTGIAGYVDVMYLDVLANTTICIPFKNKPYVLGPQAGFTIYHTVLNAALRAHFDYDEVARKL